MRKRPQKAMRGFWRAMCPTCTVCPELIIRYDRSGCSTATLVKHPASRAWRSATSSSSSQVSLSFSCSDGATTLRPSAVLFSDVAIGASRLLNLQVARCKVVVFFFSNFSMPYHKESEQGGRGYRLHTRETCRAAGRCPTREILLDG